MSQALELGKVANPPERRPRPVLRGDETGEFWLEISYHPLDEPIAIDPANLPNRVLLEAFAVLAAAAFLVVAVTLFLPGPAF